MSAHKIRVSNGKYTFRIEVGPTMFIDRHGEPWYAQGDAFGALHSIVCELDAARVVLAAARALDKRGEAPAELRNALRLHAALVDDSEHPSEWAVPS